MKTYFCTRLNSEFFRSDSITVRDAVKMTVIDSLIRGTICLIPYRKTRNNTLLNCPVGLKTPRKLENSIRSMTESRGIIFPFKSSIAFRLFLLSCLFDFKRLARKTRFIKDQGLRREAIESCVGIQDVILENYLIDTSTPQDRDNQSDNCND